MFERLRKWLLKTSPPRRDSFDAALARARIGLEENKARHKQERLARGLSESAGSGAPEPPIALYYLKADGELARKKFRELSSWDAVNAAVAERDRQMYAKLPLGGSRVGGLPDLPADMPWPAQDGKRMSFLAQINLSEAGSNQRLLPTDGWLYVFAPIVGRQPATVSFHSGPASSLVRQTDAGSAERYDMIPVFLRALDGIPGYEAKEHPRAGWLFGEISEEWGVTAGHVADRAFREGDDWINLLALHGRDALPWEDDLYVVIRRSDLEKRDFSQVLSTICQT